MYEAGLRVSEALALQDDHLETTPVGGRLVVRDGKGGKDRTVGLGRELTDELIEWLERRDERVPDCDWVFPTSRGNRVARQHLHRTVKRVARRADLPEAERLTVHCLRHSFATRFLTNGGNLEELRRALGHSSLSVSQKYLHLVDDGHVRAMTEQANEANSQPEDNARSELERLEARLSELKRRLDGE
jgi:site-specific recombinase XerD